MTDLSGVFPLAVTGPRLCAVDVEVPRLPDRVLRPVAAPDFRTVVAMLVANRKFDAALLRCPPEPADAPSGIGREKPMSSSIRKAAVSGGRAKLASLGTDIAGHHTDSIPQPVVHRSLLRRPFAMPKCVS